MNSIDLLKKYLQERKTVILWGTDNNIIPLLNILARDSLAPAAIIDGNPFLQGKKLFEIPIMSFEQADSAYQDYYIYVLGGLYRFQIIGELVYNIKFPESKIINYEPVKKKIGCKYFSNYCVQFEDKPGFCCSDFGKNVSPRSIFMGDYSESVDNWQRLRKKMEDDTLAEEKTSCSGCPEIKMDWYPQNPKLELINYSAGGICNYNCIYCKAGAKTSKGTFKTDINLIKMIEEYDRRGELSECLHIDYSPGEPALHQYRREYFSFLKGKYYTFIMTNASVYDEDLADCLRAGKSMICASVDAGTKETYFKVKGLDTYEKVTENLIKYSKQQRGVVVLKYIFLRNVNDNAENVNGFVELCKKVNPGFAFISYDLNDPIQVMTKEDFSIVKMMMNRLDSEGILWKNVSNVISSATHLWGQKK